MVKKVGLLPKKINLLLEKKRSPVWQKIKKIIKVTSLVFLIFLLLLSLGTYLYFWRVSSYGQSLEQRTEQASQKIRSLEKQEKTYLLLVQKLKPAEEILAGRGVVRNFIQEIDQILPNDISLLSLGIDHSGKVDIAIPSLSLAQIENLNEALKSAVSQGKLSQGELGGISKEEGGLYKTEIHIHF